MSAVDRRLQEVRRAARESLHTLCPRDSTIYLKFLHVDGTGRKDYSYFVPVIAAGTQAVYEVTICEINELLDEAGLGTFYKHAATGNGLHVGNSDGTEVVSELAERLYDDPGALKYTRFV